MKRAIFTLIFLLGNMSCSKSSSGRIEGRFDADLDCSGSCTRQFLSTSDVRSIINQAILASESLDLPSTIAVLDRVGNVLAVYSMEDAASTTRIDAGISATGGLEGLEVPSTLAAISKAGTAAFLSSQGNAFSTRTAGQIIQENFNPGERTQMGGPLFGVQVSQLPCSDVTTRNPDLADARSSGSKWSFAGSLGPRFLPLGLSADPGGIPLYKNGDLVGGIGIEANGTYRLDRNVFDIDNDAEERIALTAGLDFAAPSHRIASNVNVGKTLRYSDIHLRDLQNLEGERFSELRLQVIPEFTDGTLKEGVLFGSASSGVLEVTLADTPAEILINEDGSPRYPSRNGSVLVGGAELSSVEVDQILSASLSVAESARAAIRRPLSSSARVSIWVVDTEGIALGMIRSKDAPVFGIDVALQKARTALLFSLPQSESLFISSGFSDFISRSKPILKNRSFDGSIAYSSRAIGNLSRPFIPDGVSTSDFGPFSWPFPGSSQSSVTTETWSPFNTGLQLNLVKNNLSKALQLVSSTTFPESCAEGALSQLAANGIQIFAGGVPLYRGEQLVGAIGVSGDGIDQDDLIAFVGSARSGFFAPRAMRSDNVDLSIANLRLRWVGCPESPLLESNQQNICNEF